MSDIEMTAMFSFDQLVANGTYVLNGTFGWFTVGTWLICALLHIAQPLLFQIDSEGPQPFTIEIANATISPHVKLDTSSESR